MKIYETYSAQLTRALQEKAHTINLTEFLKSKIKEKESSILGKIDIRKILKSPIKSPSKNLSSGKLRSLTSRFSKTPIQLRN